MGRSGNERARSRDGSRPPSTHGKRRQAYHVCRNCPRSWVYCNRAGTPGWESCRLCNVPWPKPSSRKE
eukprot:1975763-Pyramimonas_sp.AAC.1